MIQKLNGSHPNLLCLYGWVFDEPEVLHVVMEKAERGLLHALQDGLPPIVRMNIALDVAEGLKAIHDVGYIHEDLKPGNILVCLTEKIDWELISISFLITIQYIVTCQNAKQLRHFHAS